MSLCTQHTGTVYSLTDDTSHGRDTTTRVEHFIEWFRYSVSWDPIKGAIGPWLVAIVSPLHNSYLTCFHFLIKVNTPL